MSGNEGCRVHRGVERVAKYESEPTAAVIAYGLDKKGDGERKMLIYDTGGSSTDVSIFDD